MKTFNDTNGSETILAKNRAVVTGSSKEDIRTWILQVLKIKNPSAYFQHWRVTGVLDLICKPLADCIDVEQDPLYHSENVFDHLMRTVDAANDFTSDPIVKLGALLHDVGKALTRRETMVDDEGDT